MAWHLQKTAVKLKENVLNYELKKQNSTNHARRKTALSFYSLSTENDIKNHCHIKRRSKNKERKNVREKLDVEVCQVLD